MLKLKNKTFDSVQIMDSYTHDEIEKLGGLDVILNEIKSLGRLGDIMDLRGYNGFGYIFAFYNKDTPEILLINCVPPEQDERYGYSYFDTI